MKKLFKFNRKEIMIFGFIVLMNILQGQFYYLAKLSPLPAMNLNNGLDDLIPFLPSFVYPYVLWHVLLFLVPFYFYRKDRESFYQYFTANLISDICCILIFVFFPTIIVRPSFEITSLSTFILNLVYLGDTPAGNCFPSLHCTTSFLFLYIFFSRKQLSKGSRILGIITFGSIVLSTLFVKQHVLVDVIGAFIQSLVIYLLVIHLDLAGKMRRWMEKKFRIEMRKEETE